MGQTGGGYCSEDVAANLPYVDLSLEDLKRLAIDRSLEITRRQGLLQADRDHLIALLKAYDAGLQAASGSGADSSESEEVDRESGETLSSEAELIEQQVLNAPGPKGMDIGGSLVKMALALPHTSKSSVVQRCCFPESFGVTGRTRPDLEFNFHLRDSTGYRLKFISGATAYIEETIDGVKRQREHIKASMPTLPSIESGEYQPAKVWHGEYQPANVQEGSDPSSPCSSFRRSRAQSDELPDRVAASDDKGNGVERKTGKRRERARLGKQWGVQSIYCSGGGAHKFAAHFQQSLQVKLQPVKELQAVVDGLLFINAYGQSTSSLFTIGEDNAPKRLPWPEPLFPFILVNIGSGVSVLRVDSEKENDYVRVGGTACGGATFLGLARAMTSARSFTEALELAEKGDAKKCDLLVEDIYGEEGSSSLGLPGSLTAANFGKLCESPGEEADGLCTEHDTARALLQMVTQQSVLLSSAYAKQAGCVDRVFFVGGFVEEANHLARVAIASNYRSLGGCAYFLEHCDYLGALGSLRASMRASGSSPRLG